MDMDELNHPAINIWTFFALAVLDIAVNAAAGPAAVATAAHVNGSPLTARALQLGALAGVTKSGVLAFIEFAGYAGLPTSAWILLALVASGFGTCVLVTAEISNLVLGETPSALLIAAVVAAIPLSGECMGIYQSAGGLYGGKPQTQLCVMGFNALGGYVFARMAHNGGYDVCPYSVAAAAGAVYGVITGFFHVILGCLAGFTHYESTNGEYEIRNVFGVARGYNPNWARNVGHGV
ncbi:hypothetical protein DTO013E5_2622 [Penicillium roqueforti]|nr:hypothetical protein DTO012A1_2364 [Penicillium roqueforti]KAI2753036.1 hypothetical protein DTO013F2_2684 [Penicillium roqueforti]KAI3156525.1 hypothetical protein CBS147325_225 [Penicillium roqueforti]KAI3157894.1 hypothetical protein DTO046C5_7486 [Penicillium roqueforti]KAI3216059.1 hypothetical protein DTO013E5_2622 [Penicillium roqueforti]